MCAGLGDTQTQMQFIPEREDWSFNKKFYGGSLLLDGEQMLECADKNSYAQKVVELSEQRFGRRAN